MYNPKNAAQNIKQGRIYTNKNAAESKLKFNVLMSEISQVFRDFSWIGDNNN